MPVFKEQFVITFIAYFCSSHKIIVAFSVPFMFIFRFVSSADKTLSLSGAVTFNWIHLLRMIRKQNPNFNLSLNIFLLLFSPLSFLGGSLMRNALSLLIYRSESGNRPCSGERKPKNERADEKKRRKIVVRMNWTFLLFPKRNEEKREKRKKHIN